MKTWSWLPLYTAMTAGIFGAMFSRLLYLQANVNSLTLGEIRDARLWESIVLRGCVGMCGAVVLYFFLQSGILGGELFPKYGEIALKLYELPGSDETKKSLIPIGLVFPTPALALHVVWSFLAGFSERLVPSILQSTEASLREVSIKK